MLKFFTCQLVERHNVNFKLQLNFFHLSRALSISEEYLFLIFQIEINVCSKILKILRTVEFCPKFSVLSFSFKWEPHPLLKLILNFSSQFHPWQKRMYKRSTNNLIFSFSFLFWRFLILYLH